MPGVAVAMLLPWSCHGVVPSLLANYTCSHIKFKFILSGLRSGRRGTRLKLQIPRHLHKSLTFITNVRVSSRAQFGVPALSPPESPTKNLQLRIAKFRRLGLAIGTDRAEPRHPREQLRPLQRPAPLQHPQREKNPLRPMHCSPPCPRLTHRPRQQAHRRPLRRGP